MDAGPASTSSLEEALRRARADSAAQGGAVASLREVDLARLSILEDSIRPIIDQVPKEANLFDFGKSYGDQPRLFLDMIAFVELGADRRTYRFFQDTRYGRVLIAESQRLETIVAAVTNYVARRLIERERALASDWRSAALEPQAGRGAPQPRTLPRPAVRAPKRRRGLAGAFGFVADVLNMFFIGLGALVFAGLLAAAGYYLWAEWLRALWIAHVGPAPF